MATRQDISYKSNPQLLTINADPGWKGTPVGVDGRYRNLYHPYTPSLWKVLRWKLGHNPFSAEKKQEHYKAEVSLDDSWFNGEDDVIVWLGHATFYICINGIRLITDPVFGDVWPIKRRSVFPLDPNNLKDLDYILLSHDHRDHCDEKSLKLLAGNNPQAVYLSGLGAEKLLHDFTGSAQIQTAGWFQQYNTPEGSIKITYIPSRHWCRRGAFDTNKRLWGGFVIEAGDRRIFFSGDSGYDVHYKQIAQIFGSFDYAILGIGAYRPKWFMHPMHQSPQEAVQAFKDLDAERMIPMHYGTFDLSDEPMTLPARDLKQAAEAANVWDKINVLTIGKPLVI